MRSGCIVEAPECRSGACILKRSVGRDETGVLSWAEWAAILEVALGGRGRKRPCPEALMAVEVGNEGI